ncbi:Glutathione S-transferase L3 isoform B [Glycine soja]|nr:Glutathione S-transferase L3 isoform B [Glycine soja]
MKLVPIDLQNRPAWYKEKVYPENKDPTKNEFGEHLISHVDTFNKDLNYSLKGDPVQWILPIFHLLKDIKLSLPSCSNVTSQKEGLNLQHGLSLNSDPWIVAGFL